MFIKTKDIINMPIEKIKSMFDKFSSYTNSKTLSKQEEQEFSEQMMSFSETMKQCGNGHIVSPEMKPIVKEFEKVNYDFSKLPRSLKVGFDSTYRDLKFVQSNNHEFDNSAPSLYCKIYEFFNNRSNLDFIEKLRKDPLVKKNGYTLESLTDLDSIEMWMQDDRSVEMNIGILTKTIIGKISTSIAIPNAFIAILIILTIALIALIVTLIVLHVSYKSQLTKVLKSVTAEEISEKGKENVRAEAAYTASKNMWENTSPLTKNTYYKPVEFVVSSLQRFTSQGYDKFSKFTHKFAKSQSSKEDYQYSQEFLLGGGLAIPIIVSILLLIIMIKPIIYYIYNLKMRISVFFEEEATLLEINIEDLIEMQNNATTEQEKQRIGRIIEKQRKSMINMSSLSNFFYKQTNEAALKARDDIRDNDSVDYSALVKETPAESPVVSDSASDGPVEVESTTDPNTPYETTQQLPTTGQSVVLF